MSIVVLKRVLKAAFSMALFLLLPCLPLLLCGPEPDINLHVHLEPKEEAGRPQVAPGYLEPRGKRIAVRKYKQGRTSNPRHGELKNRSNVRFESPGGATKCAYKCRW